ncbi:MFS transporter [Rhodococcus sp. ACT016]|uniref:MFS transporter n=1 Tax=Rhodococcus sp. ACT016 TaxID=3134808 RepID=UPI003D2C1965
MPRLQGNPWLVLVTLSLGFFMTLLDITVVNVALPSMSDDLEASLDEMLWVINLYILVLASLLIVSGRLGDVLGFRTMFVGGIIVFTAASVACALAQDPTQLIVARGAQGLGAAALVPQTMTLIMATFPPDRRGSALGVWGAVAGLATIAGPTLGGLLIDAAGWRSIFILNVPIGTVVIMLAVWLIPPDARRSTSRGLDLPGVGLAAVTLFCFAFALTEGQRLQWNGAVVGLLAASVFLSLMFLLHQRRRQLRDPLVPFALFRDRSFAVSSFVSASVQVGMLGLFLPVMIFLQSALAFSPLVAGLTMAPAMVASAVLSPFAGGWSDRIGGRWIITSGLALFAWGLVWLAVVLDVDRSWADLQPPLITMGLGIGCVMGPMMSEAMRNVPPEMAGAASGVLNTIRQIGTIVGSAAVGALMQNRLARSLHENATQQAVDLPSNIREEFVTRLDGHAPTASAGTASEGSIALPLPPGAPNTIVERFEAAAAHALDLAYVQAVGPTLVLPAAVVAAAAVACLLIPRREEASNSTRPQLNAGTSPESPTPEMQTDSNTSSG